MTGKSCDWNNQPCGWIIARNRNLNENFLDVKILEPKTIKLQLKLETASDEYEMIVSEMYEKLNAYISPKVHLHSLQDLIGRGLTQEEIYQGYFGEEDGYFRYGLVDMEELRSSKRRMLLSRLINLQSLTFACSPPLNTLTSDSICFVVRPHFARADLTSY